MCLAQALANLAEKNIARHSPQDKGRHGKAGMAGMAVSSSSIFFAQLFRGGKDRKSMEIVEDLWRSNNWLSWKYMIKESTSASRVEDE